MNSSSSTLDNQDSNESTLEMHEKNLRHQIMLIQSNESMSLKEKAKEIQVYFSKFIHILIPK